MLNNFTIRMPYGDMIEHYYTDEAIKPLRGPNQQKVIFSSKKKKTQNV